MKQSNNHIYLNPFIINKNKFQMKSFTKFYVLILVMLFSVGMIAQGTTPSIQQQKEQAALMELQAHGPVVNVPLTPEGRSKAVGDDCTNPIIISVPSGLPFSETNTNMNRGNNYQLPVSSRMSYYTNGEDIVYRLDVTEDVLLTLAMNPGTTAYSSIGLFEGNPSDGNCLVAAYGADANARVIENVLVHAGTQYYVLIDSWASPRDRKSVV